MRNLANKTLFLILLLQLQNGAWAETREYYQPKSISDMTPTQELVMKGLILTDKHQLPSLGASYFAQAEVLGNSTEGKSLTEEKCWAKYHLGRTLALKGLPASATAKLAEVLKSCRPELGLRPLSLNVLLPIISDLESLAKIESLIDPSKDYQGLVIPDSYKLLQAKHNAIQGDLEKALQDVRAISSHNFKAPAELVEALVLYRQGKLDESLKVMDQGTEDRLRKLPPDLKTEAQMLRARLHFQKGDYHGAFLAFSEVEKGNPMWLQAMVEQGWAQILTKDFEGAAGNMYSLHTDFFKNAFAPESYVVRAVGYLNLCQFGDSVRTLYDLNKKYQNVKGSLEGFQNEHAKADDYYDLVKTFLKNSDLRSFSGVPKYAVYELAKNRKFIGLQMQINALSDEMTKMAILNEDVLAWEKISHAKKGAEMRASLRDLRARLIVSLKAQQKELQILAAQALKDRFGQMIADIRKSVEQSELLRFEILSAAGENMRFELAGGKITDEERNYLELPKDKSFHWNFNGEVWEDELGHYRSNLKNVCGNTEKEIRHASNDEALKN